MRNTSLTLLVLMSLTALCLGEGPYRKIVHDTDPNAKCLDGSSPLLYLHEGGDKTRFLIFFVGGGLCSGRTLEETLEDCYKRSQTDLGSSNIGWPDTVNAGGYLSVDPSNKFSTWTKIIFGYCDGSLHQGNRHNPISYKGKNLYFRGAVNTRANLKWIQNHYDLRNAAQVVVTGSSAGGIATYLWTNYVRLMVSKPDNVLSIPDSGLFLNFTTYAGNEDYLNQVVVNNFRLANIDEKTPLNLCNLKYKGQEYKCLFFEYAYTSLQSRTLVVNSEYDAWAIAHTLQEDCLSQGSSGETIAQCNQDQRDYIERYHQKFRDVMEYYMMVSRHSAWTIGCTHHGYTFSEDFYNVESQQVVGMTVKQAVEAFVFEG